MDVNKIYELLENDLNDVKKKISEILNATNTKESKPVTDYLLKSQGKLIRPILVFLSSYAINEDLVNEKKDKLILIAAAIELIHMASLVHDDVIDNSDTRRNMQSVKAKFGNVTAVTMGVYLYSVALQLIAQAGSIAVLDELSSTVKKMCEGELKQQQSIKTVSTEEATYYDVIYSKTAVLFKSASLVGSLLFNISDENSKHLESFSVALGYIFQLTDDYLDIMSTEENLKKSIGQDYLKGQFTLPMIFAIEEMNLKEKNIIFESITNKDLKGLEILKSKISTEKIESKFNEALSLYVNEADTALRNLPANQFNKALSFLIEYLKLRVVSK